jgi:predicted TIM-barrel fold metal-dependent hydrolase
MDRVLSGSDWPICSMGSYVEFVPPLELAESDRRRIMYENARRLFRLPLPPSPTE